MLSLCCMCETLCGENKFVIGKCFPFARPMLFLSDTEKPRTKTFLLIKKKWEKQHTRSSLSTCANAICWRNKNLCFSRCVHTYIVDERYRLMDKCNKIECNFIACYLHRCISIKMKLLVGFFFLSISDVEINIKIYQIAIHALHIDWNI